MYKLIIVTGEPQINQPLAKILDWKNIGFEIAATFGNGTDALEYINTHHTDAVLTDIRMPVVSGVELSNVCRTAHPKVRFVFMGAHHGFGYARSATHFNVVGYITKPITYTDFFDTMVSLYNAVDAINQLNTPKKRSDFLAEEISFIRREYQLSQSSAEQLTGMVMSCLHSDSPAEALRALHIARGILSGDNAQTEKFCRQLFSELSAFMKDTQNLRIQFLSSSGINQMFNFLAEQIANMAVLEQPETESSMEKAVEYIKNHYNENITLADAASFAALSPGYFSSRFKQYTGKKFVDYLSELRISKACELLESSTIKVTAIASLVGYKDAQYFHRVFKLYTGKTPSMYRNAVNLGVDNITK